jgi:hypothetical protein
LFVGTNGVGTSIFDLNGRNQRVAGISQLAGTDCRTSRPSARRFAWAASPAPPRRAHERN